MRKKKRRVPDVQEQQSETGYATFFFLLYVLPVQHFYPQMSRDLKKSEKNNKKGKTCISI